MSCFCPKRYFRVSVRKDIVVFLPEEYCRVSVRKDIVVFLFGRILSCFCPERYSRVSVRKDVVVILSGNILSCFCPERYCLILSGKNANSLNCLLLHKSASRFYRQPQLKRMNFRIKKFKGYTRESDISLIG